MIYTAQYELNCNKKLKLIEFITQHAKNIFTGNASNAILTEVLRELT